MPPKTRITKEDILAASVDLVRENGTAALNARNVAARLNCSTEPVFSNFASMEELRLAAANAAEQLFQAYMAKETESGKYPAYKASGMAYIRFAKEEKELFKLLYMRDRSTEIIPQESRLADEMESIIQNSTHLSEPDAKLFHLEMWACVHGIAAMTATGFLDLDWDLIGQMLTDLYQGLKKQYEEKEQTSWMRSERNR